jgi:CheY-like chemotaxis protein
MTIRPKGKGLSEKENTMKRVLLVDDNDALLFAFKRLSLSSGIAVETANTVESAVGLLSNEHFDVVISDLNMTGVATHEGWKIIKTAKRFNRLIRAFIWTAYDGKNIREQAAEIGVEGFLAKPVTFDTLLSTINADATNGEI